MKQPLLKKLILSAMFIALGIVLPFLTGQIPQVGNMLLPIHIPVFLCGLICGWQYGAVVGLVLPLMRSAIFGMPPPFPTATAMAFEMAVYGLVVGFLYAASSKQNIFAVYRAMIAAMLAGRIVWGVVQLAFLTTMGNAFTWEMFMAGAFLNAIPGIIVQLVLIPAIMVALQRAKLVPLQHLTPVKHRGN